MSTQPSPAPAVIPPIGSPADEPSGIVTFGRSGGAIADLVLRVITGGSAVVIILMLAVLVAVLTLAAMPTIKAYGLSFIASTDWRPNELERPLRDANSKIVLDEFDEPVMEVLPPVFGAANVIYGTAVSSLLALLFAVPLSIGAAVFLVRVAPDLSPLVVRYFLLGASVFFLVLGLCQRYAPGVPWALATVAALLGASGAGFAASRLLKRPGLAALHRDIAIHALIWAVLAVVIPLMFGVAWYWGALVGLGGTLMLYGLAIRLVQWVSFLVEFLAAIPSIAYGIWGLFVLAPFLQSTVEPFIQSALHGVPGFGWLFYRTIEIGGKAVVRPIALTGRDMFSGGLILGIMIVPIITAVSRDILRGVPGAQVEGTTALGATWWQSSKEMLKFSRSGLFGAITLGLARAAGETMAVTMVIGNNNQIVASPFAPAQTMSSLLANEFAEVTNELHRSALIEVALVLLVMSLAFNVIARWLVVGGDSRSAAAH